MMNKKIILALALYGASISYAQDVETRMESNRKVIIINKSKTELQIVAGTDGLAHDLTMWVAEKGALSLDSGQQQEYVITEGQDAVHVTMWLDIDGAIKKEYDLEEGTYEIRKRGNAIKIKAQYPDPKEKAKPARKKRQNKKKSPKMKNGNGKNNGYKKAVYSY